MAIELVEEYLEFQSTPLMRGATSYIAHYTGRTTVSIHAPHARGDMEGQTQFISPNVSIHAPHARGDLSSPPPSSVLSVFQSTPLMRGATTAFPISLTVLEFQSTPLMRGATLIGLITASPLLVSIHAPHARGDLPSSIYLLNPSCFNPRPSCEGRLAVPAKLHAGARVSIHAPHARGDLVGRVLEVVARVSIHAPHARGDDRERHHALRRPGFQSTPLMRGATARCCETLNITYPI